MTVIKNVALVGTGNLSVFYVKEFKKAGSEFNLTVFTRPESLDKAKKLTGNDPKIEIRTVAYTNEEEIAEALKDQDVVLCLLAFEGQQYQPYFINAAQKAGVKWFIPSEFGVDLENPRNASLIFFNDKVQARKQLESQADMAYTYIMPGAFADQFIIPFHKWDVENHTVTISGDGNTKFSLTSRRDVAAYTLAILRRFDQFRNKSARLAGYTMTPNELLRVVEDVTGHEFEVTYEPLDVVEARITEGLQKNSYDPEVISDCLALSRGLGDSRVDWDGQRLDSELLTEVTPLPIAQVISESL
ncbi:hypothetical protein GGI07_000582 [Coemansia sp. Benny D115]|nr:hypothetical protein GGI07_000582 [Coemansia sp. Benny D115]